MAMDYSENLFELVKTYFEEDEAHYDVDEENGYFVANYNVGNKDNESSISSCRLHILVHNEGITMRFAVRGFKAKEKTKPYVALLLAYINDSMRYGNFEMDMDDGEVAFKCSNLLPPDMDYSYEYFDRIICLGLSMLKKYADALVPIMLGYSQDCEAAYKCCQDN